MNSNAVVLIDTSCLLHSSIQPNSIIFLAKMGQVCIMFVGVVMNTQLGEKKHLKVCNTCNNSLPLVVYTEQWFPNSCNTESSTALTCFWNMTYCNALDCSKGVVACEGALKLRFGVFWYFSQVVPADTEEQQGPECRLWDSASLVTVLMFRQITSGHIVFQAQWLCEAVVQISAHSSAQSLSFCFCLLTACCQ